MQDNFETPLTSLLEGAHTLTEAADMLLAHLEKVEKDTPAKQETYEMIEIVVRAQSKAIRDLVELQANVYDMVEELRQTPR